MKLLLIGIIYLLSQAASASEICALKYDLLNRYVYSSHCNTKNMREKLKTLLRGDKSPFIHPSEVEGLVTVIEKLDGVNFELKSGSIGAFGQYHHMIFIKN